MSRRCRSGTPWTARTPRSSPSWSTDFNKKNAGKIEVKATYAGKYDDAITKYKAAIQSKSTPDVIQIYDIGTRFMIDAKQTVPMQSFIDRDKLDVSDLQPNIAGYYSVDNKLHSMPFNTSMPVLYYNKTLFKKAGLDPDKPPRRSRRSAPQPRSCPRRTAARPTTASARPSTAGCSSSSSPPDGADYCDQGNGRDGKATKVMFDQGEALEVVAWWQKMVKDGLAANTGRDTKAAQAAFKSGQAGDHPGVHRPARRLHQGRQGGRLGARCCELPEGQGR